jgi:hypothetical protein
VFVTSKLQYAGTGLISPLIYSDIVCMGFRRRQPGEDFVVRTGVV